MKRVFSLALLLAWLCGSLSAQNTASRSLDAMTSSMFERLDKNALRSGILLQQSAMFVNPFRYDGIVSDSNKMDASRFGKLFGQLRAASTTKSTLPDPAVYLDPLRWRTNRSDTVLLAMMAMQFDYIREDAFSRGLLRWDEDQKIRDVPDRAISPYRMDTTFVFSALNQQITGNQVVFQMPASFVFNNLNWKVGRFQIDFGDGLGWRTMRPGECVTVHYQKYGEKSIRIKVQEKGRSWEGHSFVVLSQPKKGSDWLAEYSSVPDETVALGGVTLSMFFDCPDRKLRKPLIVVEGFGGDLTTYTKMQELLNNPTSNQVLLKDFLDDENYDLIWVDWGDANARIQDNAAALQAAIEYINKRKHADGSSEPNAMIGASMGGLVGKYCLLSMHNAQGIDAEVERFFTYDSPLKGANFPVGIQLMIRDLLNFSGSAASDPNIQAALQLLDGYAATQMLRQKAIIDPNGNLALTSASFDALQAEMDALSAIKPLTGITRHIALSNGAGNGTTQESVTYALALSFGITIDGVPWGGAPYWQYDVLIQGTAYTARQSTTLLYERTTKVIPIIGSIQLIESVSYTHPTALGLDVAPGGNSNIGLDQLEAALNNAFANVPDQIGYNVSLFIDHFCFEPTVSSLGLPITTDLFAPVPGGPASVSSVSQDNTVISTYSQQPEYNQEHVSMNPRIADVLEDELKAHPVAEALGSEIDAGKIYNFGKAFDPATQGGILSTPREITEDLVIKSGSQLWINRKDRIAFTSNPANPDNIVPQNFYVSVPGARCEGSQKVVVTIDDGGRLVVGDTQNAPENAGGLFFTSSSELYAAGSNPILLEDAAQLSFDPGSHMELKAGAELRAKTGASVSAKETTWVMEPGSRITFESNGKFDLENTSIDVPQGSEIALLDGSVLRMTGQTSVLRIRPGATLRLSGESMARIAYGATLILDPGAIIVVQSYESQIRVEGKLVYNGDFSFTGLGYFTLDGSHTLEFGPGATHFRLIGMLPYNRTLRLDNHAVMVLPSGIDLILNRGGVEYVGGSSIQLGTNSDVTCTYVRFFSNNQGGAPCLLGHTKPGDITISNCRFENIEQAMQITGGQGNNPFLMQNNITIANTHFSNYSLGLDIHHRQGVGFRNCTFDGGGMGGGAAYAINSDQNFFTLMRNCDISGHRSNNQVSNFNANDLLVDFTLRQGVQVNGGFLFWMEGGSIVNCDIGISNRVVDALGQSISHVPSNLILTQQATLEDCLSGISMEGSATQGLVMASCARFRWNIYGISGNDITLLIDPTLMNPNPNFSPMPNTFLRNTWGPGGAQNKHLSICYSLKDPGGSIPATKNFWGNWDPFAGAVIPELNPTPAFNVRRNPGTAVGCSDTNPLVPVVWSPAFPNEPMGCYPEEACESAIAPCWNDCSEPTLTLVTVRNQFQSGLNYLLAEQPAEGYNAVQPVSELWQSELPSGYTVECRTLIHAAKSLADGESQSRASFMEQQTERVESGVKIQPNPTAGQTNVLLPEGLCTVRVWDMMGRLVYETQALQACELETASWAPGIYLVDVVREGVAKSEQKRLVVHR